MQGELAPIRGEEWRPRRHLDFNQSIDSMDVRNELLRFVAERHDGHLRLVEHLWAELHPESTKFDGATFHEISEEFVNHLEENLDSRRSETTLQPIIDSEVIPRRLGHLHLNRRLKRFLIDIRLCLRRIAYSCMVTTEMRMEWQRLMHRTRVLDTHLKDLFVNGVETPDGGRFGGKGFRSTWQEGVVACATSLNRAMQPVYGCALAVSDAADTPCP